MINYALFPDVAALVGFQILGHSLLSIAVFIMS